MKKSKVLLKLIVLSMLIALGVVISPILRVEGMCPMAHLINIVCSVFLGPWYSLLCATPAVIKGNYSEIMALCGSHRAAGVDADSALELAAVDRAAAELAKNRGTVIMASGKTDVITDGKRLFHLKNGTPQLAAVTGTGCMLGALCACCLSVQRDLTAVVTAGPLLHSFDLQSPFAAGFTTLNGGRS